MLRSYLASALRNLRRTKLYATLGIVTLALGLSGALIAGLLIRHHFSYEYFIAERERLWLAVSVLMPTGRAPDFNLLTHAGVASLLALRADEVAATTRLLLQQVDVRSASEVNEERIYWADANAFSLLRVPVIEGDLSSALRAPDGLVLSRSKAAQYFGAARAIGQQLVIAGEPMTVRAVIEDFPAQATRFETDVFAAGHAAHSALAALDRELAGEQSGPGFSISVLTLVKARTTAVATKLEPQMPGLIETLLRGRSLPPGVQATMRLVRVDRVHLTPELNPGIGARIAFTAVAGALVLVLAIVNFVSLSIARVATRRTEVGVRKVVGASRAALVVQFSLEFAAHALVAAVLAVSLAELMLPTVNRLLDTGARFRYWTDGRTVFAVALTLLLALAAAIYPAVRLASRPPRQLLSGRAMSSRSLGRASMVALQFAILIGLVAATGIVHQQRRFAIEEALRVPTEEIVVLERPCDAALSAELRKLDGVRAAACTGWQLFSGASFANLELPGRTVLAITHIPADVDLFTVLGQPLIAGRSSQSTAVRSDQDRGVVINAQAAAALGFPTPQAALGAALPSYGRIIAVVPDFSLAPVEQEMTPALFVHDPDALGLTLVRIAAGSIPETLAAIDRVAVLTGGPNPVRRFFMSDYMEGRYRQLLREQHVLTGFAVLAGMLAALGLFGLSASRVELRTKEIGIRKALGASTAQVVRLLLVQFTRPVVWAALIACPVTAVLMQGWLAGFAQRIELGVGWFITAAVLASALALASAALHCYRIARTRLVQSLRYE